MPLHYLASRQGIPEQTLKGEWETGRRKGIKGHTQGSFHNRGVRLVLVVMNYVRTKL